MTLSNAINLFRSERRHWIPVYALIQTEVRETIPVDLASTCDDMGGIISCLREAPTNGGRLHLNAVVDINTCLRHRGQRTKSNCRYKHE